MAFTTLLDGGLSVKIAGVERAASVHGLEWESTNQGDGAASFWVEIADPFNPQTTFPELLHGASVVVTHTLSAATTTLYSGYVVSDPRAGYAGEKAIVQVECGGVLDVIAGRTDMGFVFTDADTSQWIENRRNAKCHQVDTGDRIDIRVADGSKVTHDTAGMVGYAAYLGAQYLLNVLPGVKRLTGTVSFNLKDSMKASLIWSPAYKASRDVSDYTVVHTWSANTTAKNAPIDYTFGGANGAGYVALALWCDKTGGVTTTAERFVTIDDCVLYTGTVQKTVDQAMLAVAQAIGLAPGGYSTAAIGSVLPSLVCRPHADPVTALATFAAQAPCLVEWGYFLGQFRAKPLRTNPVTIRALPNCYSLDAEAAGVTWDVTQHPENGIPRSVRFLYGRSSKSDWPAGSPASVVAPRDPGWVTGKPFLGTSAPVLTVDFTQHNYTAAHAKALATSLAAHLGMCLSSGPASLTVPTIPVYGGGTMPVPYIHGADWIECQQGAAGPLYITRAHVAADTGYVDMDVGLSADLLIEQLAAAGGISTVKLHKPHRRKR